MSIAIANLPLPVSCNDRSRPVAVPLGQRPQTVHFYPLRGVRDGYHEVAADPPKVIAILMTSSFADLYQKVQTQIPIALSSILTTLLHPAVSSLEACKTPAR
jgi:hypothetical protein